MMQMQVGIYLAAELEIISKSSKSSVNHVQHGSYFSFSFFHCWLSQNTRLLSVWRTACTNCPILLKPAGSWLVTGCRARSKKRWFQARNLGNPATLLKWAAWLANFRPDRRGYLCHLANVPNQRCFCCQKPLADSMQLLLIFGIFRALLKDGDHPEWLQLTFERDSGTRGDGTLWCLTLSLRVRRRRLSLLTQKRRKIKKKETKIPLSPGAVVALCSPSNW